MRAVAMAEDGEPECGSELYGCVDEPGGEASLVGRDAGIGGHGHTDKDRAKTHSHDDEARQHIGQ